MCCGDLEFSDWRMCGTHSLAKLGVNFCPLPRESHALSGISSRTSIESHFAPRMHSPTPGAFLVAV